MRKERTKKVLNSKEPYQGIHYKPSLR